MSVQSSQALNELLDIERRYDIAQWRIDGVHVWPLVRVWLFTDTMNRELLQDEAPSSAAQFRIRARRLIQARWRVASASWQDRRANAQLDCAVEAVFYSDGVNFVRVGGLWYDKLFDPIIGWLRRHGGKHLMLTPMEQAYHPRASASRFVQPRLDAIKLLASLKSGVAGEVNLPGFDAAMAGRSMTRPRLLRLWNRLLALSEYFGSVLKRARPARAFVNTYYSIEGMAFVLACRRCGVPVADVQHGIQGDYHAAYGQWLNIPAAGYDLLPDEFWVWGDDERRAIDCWRPRGSRIHAPVVAGNAWLELWRGAPEPFVALALHQAHLLRRVGARCCVLVTLQWGLQEEETLNLLRAIGKTPADFQWWLRLHPLVAQERGPLRAMVKRCGLSGVEIDGPTDLPLHALLRVADVHVTHGSSAVIEAAEFGVPSVVCSDYGVEYFAAQIAAGLAVPARSDQEIATAVEALAARGRGQIRSRRDGGTLEAALAQAFPLLST